MAIVRKDILLSGYHGNLESVIIEKGGVAVESTNGVFVKVGKYLEGQRETKHAELAGAADIAEDVVFIHNSEVMADPRLQKLADYRIKAGKVARGYRLNDGDVLTLTEDLFDGEVAVDDVLAVSADGKLGKVAGAETAKVVFTVVEDSGFELHQTMRAFAVEISRN